MHNACWHPGKSGATKIVGTKPKGKIWLGDICKQKRNWYLDQLSATGSNRKSIHTENEPPWSILTWSMSIGHDCCPGPFNVDQEPRDTDSFPKRLWDSCSTKSEIYVRKYSPRGHHASTLKGPTRKILCGIAICVQHWRGRSHKHRRETHTDFKLILTRVGRAPF